MIRVFVLGFRHTHFFLLIHRLLTPVYFVKNVVLYFIRVSVPLNGMLN